jgi:hypothetical protein
MMVARGFSTDGTARLVAILDPLPENVGDERSIPYDEYVAGSKYSHWQDFYQISRIDQGPAPGAAPVANAEQKANKPAPAAAPVANAKQKANKADSTRGMLNFSDAIRASSDAAQTSLGTVEKILAEKDGVSGPPAALELGSPLPVIWVGLNDLKGGPGGTDAMSTLASMKTDQVVFPVRRGTEIASAVTLEKKDDHWQPVAYGNKNLTKMLIAVRNEYRDAHHLEDKDFYQVSIPALNMYFIGTGRGDNATLIPVFDDPKIGIKKGQPAKATDIMPKLVSKAKTEDELPH